MKLNTKINSKNLVFDRLQALFVWLFGVFTSQIWKLRIWCEYFSPNERLYFRNKKKGASGGSNFWSCSQAQNMQSCTYGRLPCAIQLKWPNYTSIFYSTLCTKKLWSSVLNLVIQKSLQKLKIQNAHPPITNPFPFCNSAASAYCEWVLILIILLWWVVY